MVQNRPWPDVSLWREQTVQQYRSGQDETGSVKYNNEFPKIVIPTQTLTQELPLCNYIHNHNHGCRRSTAGQCGGTGKSEDYFRGENKNKNMPLPWHCPELHTNTVFGLAHRALWPPAYHYLSLTGLRWTQLLSGIHIVCFLRSKQHIRWCFWYWWLLTLFY